MSREYLKDILAQEPKTMPQLQKLGVSKDTITRAVKASEVLAEAVIRHSHGQGSRFVTLYCLSPNQLDRVKGNVYLSRWAVRKIEKSTILKYFEAHQNETYIWLENMQNELGFSLTDQSPASAKRRDFIFHTARENGLTVREGYDESIAVGSKIWWKRHRDDVVGNIEGFLARAPSRFRLPDESDLLSFYPKYRIDPDHILEFGSQISGISFPTFDETLYDSKIRDSLSLPLQHTEVKKRQELENTLEESLAHSRKASSVTSEIWRTIEYVLKPVAVDASVDLASAKGRGMFLHGIYFVYHLMACRANGLQTMEFEVVGIPPAVGYSHPDMDIVETVFDTHAFDSQTAENYVEKLNRFSNDETLVRKIKESLESVRLADEKYDRFKEELGKLVEKWRSVGLSGKCDHCRNIGQLKKG